MKSEPKVYSIADLQQERETIWEGVRNYQARNFLRQMNKGNLVFIYHSNIIPPGIVGLMRVVKVGVIDPTQFDSTSPYYDPQSTAELPRWQTVGVEFVEAFSDLISLETLKLEFDPQEILVVKRGNRLSVMPVEEAVARKILGMASKNDTCN